MSQPSQVFVRREGANWTWSIAVAGGLTLAGPAPSREAARRSADFVSANLEALARIGRRRRF